MSSIRAQHTLGDLADDLSDVARQAPRQMHDIVRNGIRVGNSVAKDNAKRSAGSHGKHYHRAFSTEMHGALSALSGGGLHSGEYGPDASKPQGDMSFEFGSRNQPPHLDLARSADLMGSAMQREVGEMVDRLFW